MLTAKSTQNFNIPIQIQPQIFCCLALTTWSQILIYNQYQLLHLPPEPLVFLLTPINQRLASMESLPPRLRNRSRIRRYTSPSRLDVTSMSYIPSLSFLPIEAIDRTYKGPYGRGVEWPMTLVGVISAILLAGGLIPPYFEIAKRNGRVVGISMSTLHPFNMSDTHYFCSCWLTDDG